MDNSDLSHQFSVQLLKQFESKWIMLKSAIEKCPDQYWNEAQDGWTFSHIIFHIIETANFYSRSNPDEMDWGKKAGINWEENTEEEIIEKKSRINKTFLFNYSKEIESRISNFLLSTNDKDLLKKDDFPWFDSIYEKLIYLLRHNSYHIGELAQILRASYVDRLKWS